MASSARTLCSPHLKLSLPPLSLVYIWGQQYVSWFLNKEKPIGFMFFCLIYRMSGVETVHWGAAGLRGSFFRTTTVQEKKGRRFPPQSKSIKRGKRKKILIPRNDHMGYVMTKNPLSLLLLTMLSSVNLLLLLLKTNECKSHIYLFFPTSTPTMFGISLR